MRDARNFVHFHGCCRLFTADLLSFSLFLLLFFYHRSFPFTLAFPFTVPFLSPLLFFPFLSRTCRLSFLALESTCFVIAMLTWSVLLCLPSCLLLHPFSRSLSLFFGKEGILKGCVISHEKVSRDRAAKDAIQ